MKKTLFFSLSLALNFFAMAQTDLEKSFEQFKAESESKFSSYEDEQQKKFDEFRKKANEDFARMLGEPWEKEEVKEAVPVPTIPEPVKPIEKKKDEPKPVKKEIKVQEIKETPKEYVAPQPIVPIVKEENIKVELSSFEYYGTKCEFTWTDDMKFSLSAVNEKAVADAWLKLSSEKYDALLVDCLKLREEMGLCDWAYINMIEKMAKSVLGNAENEVIVLQMYLLTQSGYKMKMGKANGHLVLLMPSDVTLYGYTYVTLEDGAYYVLSNRSNEGSYEIFDSEFPNAQMPSMQMTRLPNFKETFGEKRTFTSKRYPNVSVNVAPNTNLMNFYTEYPHSEWNYYSQASLSPSIKRDLYPSLRSIIDGETQIEAANILINFVQTAFEYKTDEEQFGYERTLFGDEMFYYPYSDCEDRSVLFSILVRELLGLDVVLLNYPGHLATAVHFTEEPQGHYMTIDNKNYVVCDPTYIGASVGDVMPQFGNVPAKIIRISKN